MHNIFFVLLRRLHLPLITLVCVYAISILGFVLIPGVDDQGQPWRMDFFHAFYFVSFMGTTIGFGEIPYPFTDAQRMWTLVSIYSTVIAWLYAIGVMLATLQNPGIRRQLTAATFRRAIRRLREPFYLICGYGDTGSKLVQAFTEAGIRTVVVEIQQDRVNELELADHRLFVPGLCADASDPENLMQAGLTTPYCIGVIALTNVDVVNLKVAITAKLLNPPVSVIARAETRDVGLNIASFGSEHIMNPFEIFADRLAMALHAPGFFLLHEWMTSVPHEALSEPLFPPRGMWILCGYGRFGKAVHKRLLEEGLEVVIIEAQPEMTHAPQDVIVGTGTEAVTLQQAGIEHAVGIVAGTDDDANNLSILMTARQLNRDLFMVSRQNSRKNDAIFQAAELDLVMQRGSIIAHTIFALVRAPLLGVFLAKARQHDNEWANSLVSRISGITADESPLIWEIAISAERSPALHDFLDRNEVLTLRDLYRDPRDRERQLPCVPLLHRRDETVMLLPGDDSMMASGDQILFCGLNHARSMMEWLINNQNVFSYILSGEEHASSYLGRLFSR